MAHFFLKKKITSYFLPPVKLKTSSTLILPPYEVGECPLNR